MKHTILALATAAFCATAFGDIYMAGDSTMCNYRKSQYPQQGWGQALPLYMKDPAKLHNYAVGGRSAKSFKAEGRWQKLVDELKAGDYVILAFGHNDANRAKQERYSSPEYYTELLKGFAADVAAKGASMVFATSIPHSGGFSQDAEGNMHVRGSAAGIGPYVAATVKLAEELGLPVLDLNKYAVENLPSIGLDKAYHLYMRIDPGEYDNYPNGKSDACHTRDTGANFYARAAVKLAFAQNLPICEMFKDPESVVYTPIPKGGPDASVAEAKDDFSKEGIAYAGAAEKTPVEAAKEWLERDWRKKVLDLEREARRNGMNKEDARKWAAQELHKRDAEAKAKLGK